MIVKFRDFEDSSMFILEIASAVYDPDSKSMLLYSVNNDEVIVNNITQDNSDTFIEMLYTEGKLDLCSWPALLNPEGE